MTAVAIVLLLSLAQPEAGSPKQLINEAARHATAGRDAEAINTLGRFIEALREQPQARSLVPEASRIAEEVQARSPGDFQSGFRHAELLYLAGRYSDALAALTRIRTQGQTNADYYNLAGMSYAGLNDLSTASRAVIKAIELAPDRPDLLVNLAGLYQRARNNKAALLALKKAVDMPTAPPEAFFALAMTHYNLGDYQATIDNCRQATTRQPNFDKAFLLKGRAYAGLKNLSSASTAYRRALEINPACDTCQFELALLAPSASDAERLLRATLEINPRHAAAHFHLGKLLAEQNRTQDALAELEQAIALDQDLDGGYYQLAQIYRKRGDAQRARELFASLQARKEQRRAASEANLSRAGKR